MSLRPRRASIEPLRFPRVSGDEPWWGVADVFKTQFSPRERG